MFASEEIKSQLEDSGVDFVFITTEHEATSLRNLDSRNINGLHQILLVTDGLVMRGSDFRAPIKGLCLMIAKPFES